MIVVTFRFIMCCLYQQRRTGEIYYFYRVVIYDIKCNSSVRTLGIIKMHKNSSTCCLEFGFVYCVLWKNAK